MVLHFLVSLLMSGVLFVYLFPVSLKNLDVSKKVVLFPGKRTYDPRSLTDTSVWRRARCRWLLCEFRGESVLSEAPWFTASWGCRQASHWQAAFPMCSCGLWVNHGLMTMHGALKPSCIWQVPGQLTNEDFGVLDGGTICQSTMWFWQIFHRSII